MTDYSELVKALRCCGNVNTDCTVCPWDKYNFGMCAEKLLMDAAAAIEALQATIELMKPFMPDFFPDANNVVLPKLEPKRGEWELIDGAEPMRWGCSRCKYMSWETLNYCPRCGAKMTEVQE